MFIYHILRKIKYFLIFLKGYLLHSRFLTNLKLPLKNKNKQLFCAILAKNNRCLSSFVHGDFKILLDLVTYSDSFRAVSKGSCPFFLNVRLSIHCVVSYIGGGEGVSESMVN